MLRLLKGHLRIMERHRQSILDELDKAKRETFGVGPVQLSSLDGRR
jgi:hypothetical protein